jgi:hypothetical protein
MTISRAMAYTLYFGKFKGRSLGELASTYAGRISDGSASRIANSSRTSARRSRRSWPPNQPPALPPPDSEPERTTDSDG